MDKRISIPIALRLPAPDIEALIQGRTIAALPRIFINPGRQFALYPADTSTLALPIEQYYRPSFYPTAQNAIAQLNSESVPIKAWARCELCQVLDSSEPLDFLSQLSVWTPEALQQTRFKRGNIFLAYLRVYRLPQPVEVPTHPNPRFVPLPEPLTVTETTPILNNTLFTQRCRQMEERQPPQHLELEALQGAVAQLSDTNLAAKELDRDIRNFLGWTNERSIQRLDSDLIWIQTIAAVGNSSDGHAFEKLVRKSLAKLGFTGSGLAPDATGGAGGMDFYCEFPYPMVGECKATKTEKVTDSTPAQLHKIGMNHLGKAQYECSIKLIVAAGDLNTYARRTATEHQMNVIRPETLQRLVELQAKYKGSVDLLALKRRLEVAPFGLADEKIEQYLAEVRRDVEVRSHLVRAVRQLGDLGSKHLTAEIRIQYNAIFAKEPKSKLQDLQQVHHLLVELSSPLTGYLGRERGSDWKSDRFYFLRELD